MVCLLVVHKGSNGPTSVGMTAGLTANMNSGLTNTKLVNGTRDSARRGRHCVAVMRQEITRVVDGERPANGVPYIPSWLGQ